MIMLIILQGVFGNIRLGICTRHFKYFFYHLQWLPWQDDERLATIKSEYSKGAMLTGEVKKELIGILQVR